MSGLSKRFVTATALTAMTVLAVACGSESNGAPGSSGATSTATAGSSCYVGNDCPTGQYCLVEGDPKGTCTALPAACRASDCKCLSDSACGDAGGGSMCEVQGRATVGCGRTRPENLRKQGEACSHFDACADGLMCFVSGALPGTCEPSPAACETADQCDCIERETASACPPGKAPSCSGEYAIAHYITVTCK